MLGKLEYKHRLRSVRQEPQSEQGTSSHCAACGEYTPSSRWRRGLWVCRECSAVAHADLNSSQNQLKKYVTGTLTGPNRLEFAPPAVYRWDEEANRFINVSAGNGDVAVVVGSS
jgi:transposase